ncbi:unnamed protein product [Didymodactylos carnosus]|uniref:NHL repeat-containing protein n=1 Tax=Didymodactylos carnosus TaxID=1234261 RepID=A0A815YH91_9BILA|nr:unnamed protein product [Didymodactylos carnosus]CAF1570507.1 unnamed protein product [Didymodactylos carnosus]CAF3885686.1 unnamed protein product [Didymodactylos carnosus]CAF4433806.1 unnamed protein product [Didymodactylos carnosus]
MTTTTTTPVCVSFTQPPPHSICKNPKWSQNGIRVAGNVIAGSTSSQLNHPRGIFIDRHDDLYIADSWNSRVQRFVQNSLLGATVAGGNGEGNGVTQLSSPQDVFVDSVGNLFIADYGSYRIQKWTMNSGQGTTVAGNGTDQSCRPRGVFVDKKDIYVSDHTTGYLMKYSSLDSNFGTVIAKDISSSAGMFVDQCDTVYVADSGRHSIEKFMKNSSRGITVAGIKYVRGSASNQLSGPNDVTSDQYGNLYIADTGNHRIQRVSAKDGRMKTIVGITGEKGTDAKHLDEPVSVALDSEWNLYVSDYVNSRIQKFSFESGDLYC